MEWIKTKERLPTSQENNIVFLEFPSEGVCGTQHVGFYFEAGNVFEDENTGEHIDGDVFEITQAFRAKNLLDEILYHINTDPDMSGNCRYTLRVSAFPHISTALALLSGYKL